MATSNTYLFGSNATLDDLFREAYENIGIPLNVESAQQIQSAIYSANLELSTWGGKGLNLFQIIPSMITLAPNQSTYQLPANTIRIPYGECAVAQPARLNVGGTAYSSNGGTASNCFDPTQTAGCVQTAPNGYISYNYGVGVQNSILYVGVTSLIQTNYTLAIEYSNDNTTWNTLFLSPTQVFYPNIVKWFVLQNSVPAQYWRIRETQGATLEIAQIYLSIPNANQTNRMIAPLSRYQYLSMQTTFTSSNSITGYYLNLTNPPVLVVYPSPNTAGYNLLFNCYCYPQDVVYLFQNVQVPQKFMDALMRGISHRLAFKFKPEILQQTDAAMREAYALAAAMDFENVPLGITPNMSMLRAI
jgi:hypothetical protein